MSIKSAIAHIHSIFATLEHPGAIPADIKEYALKGIKAELQKLIDRVDLSLSTAQNTATADGAGDPAPALTTTKVAGGAYAVGNVAQNSGNAALVDTGLSPVDYLPPQSAVPVHGDEPGPQIDLAAESNKTGN